MLRVLCGRLVARLDRVCVADSPVGPVDVDLSTPGISYLRFRLRLGIALGSGSSRCPTAAGDPVSVTLMGDVHLLQGQVDSVAEGIVDRDRTTGSNLLSSVTPNFNWVRLAQRIPVRIRLDRVPENMHLVAGQTATVAVQGRVGPERSMQ